LDVLRRLHESFPQEWKTTSSHAFRSSDDMQFAFAYFYFLINERQKDVWPRLLHQLVDTDRDQIVSANEFRTLWAMTHDSPINEGDMSRHYALLTVNETVPLTAQVLDSHPSQELTKKAKSYFEKLPRNLHELHDTEEVGFVMIRNNDTALKGRLDGIRRKRHKFICLNDNLKHEAPDTLAVKQFLHSFYESLLPLPSVFERQPGALRADALFFWLLVIIGLVFLCWWLSYFARKMRKTD
jgi:UDP-N-acetylglucosamine-lysosomal-enzyme